jgi:hypothetical protein
VAAAVDGAVDGCRQYATVPCTPCGTDAICTGTISETTLSVTSCSFGTLHVNDTIAGTGIIQPAYITVIGSCASPPGTCTLNASQTVGAAETIPAQPPMAPANPVQYADVSQATWSGVVQTYTPRFWEISFGDATTTTGTQNPCPITGPEQMAMDKVFADATTQLECAEVDLVKAAFGTKVGHPGYNRAADVNNDGVVNIFDLAVVTQHLPAGTVCH